jgi:hypothetical protein
LIFDHDLLSYDHLAADTYGLWFMLLNLEIEAAEHLEIMTASHLTSSDLLFSANNTINENESKRIVASYHKKIMQFIFNILSGHPELTQAINNNTNAWSKLQIRLHEVHTIIISYHLLLFMISIIIDNNNY